MEDLLLDRCFVWWYWFYYFLSYSIIVKRRQMIGDMMSYWISLRDENDKILTVPRFDDAVVGSSTDANLHITYNYCCHFKFRKLNGKKAGDIKQRLLENINRLGIVRDPDYWAPTKGNAGYALFILYNWANLHKEGRFKVSRSREEVKHD